MINTGFSKKIFALLMDRAKGDRTLRHYAAECGISYVQLRKLELMRQENPPRPALIKKLADHSQGDVTYEDLMFAAGYKDESLFRKDEPELQRKIRAMNPGQLAKLELFADFLIYKGAKTKEETPTQE